jgi:D-aminopeptidase
VQANYGTRADLRVDGVPVGRYLPVEKIPGPRTPAAPGGSIIVVIATDAPVLADGCRRLAQRATVGLARVGGIGHNGSGDIFLAFATGNHLPYDAKDPVAVRMLPPWQMNDLFQAAVEAVEESILNALTAAETMTGFMGRTVHALPLDELVRLVQQDPHKHAGST